MGAGATKFRVLRSGLPAKLRTEHQNVANVRVISSSHHNIHASKGVLKLLEWRLSSVGDETWKQTMDAPSTTITTLDGLCTTTDTEGLEHAQSLNNLALQQTQGTCAEPLFRLRLYHFFHRESWCKSARVTS